MALDFGGQLKNLCKYAYIGDFNSEQVIYCNLQNKDEPPFYLEINQKTSSSDMCQATTWNGKGFEDFPTTDTDISRMCECSGRKPREDSSLSTFHHFTHSANLSS